MPLAAQTKMLRLLQDQTFERVGGQETIHTRVRIVAATNQDLERRIVEGHFRADLFYRLRGVSIHVPPLRERAEDIPELCHHFLYLFNRELELNIQGLDPETLLCLRRYRWPGNVREMQGVLKEAMLRTTGTLLLPESLPPTIHTPSPLPTSQSSHETEQFDLNAIIETCLARGDDNLHSRIMEVMERVLFKRVLQETNGHLGHACERLGLNRSTLRYKLRELGLSLPTPDVQK
jgi:two-component system nitrogen regulation response regulator GlnG